MDWVKDMKVSIAIYKRVRVFLPEPQVVLENDSKEVTNEWKICEVVVQNETQKSESLLGLDRRAIKGRRRGKIVNSSLILRNSMVIVLVAPSNFAMHGR